MYYLVTYIPALLIFAGLIFSKFFVKKNTLILKIIALIGAAVFAVRIFCYEPKVFYYFGLESSPIKDKTMAVFSALFIWSSYACILFCLITPFFNIKYGNNIVKFICFPLMFSQGFFIENMSLILCRDPKNIILPIFYSIETAFGIGISLFYLVRHFIDKESFNWKDLLIMIVSFMLLILFVMPAYLPGYLLGDQKWTYTLSIKDLTPAHRMVIYIGIIIPLVIHFTLTNKSEETRRYTLLYMVYGTMLVYNAWYSYKSFSKPWNWPLHLCNTAMYILPLSLTFKMKKLFYFTYFINVVGAFIAWLIPSYPASQNLLTFRVFSYWYNHYVAFFMPILFVSLRMFKRPKLKEFFWSMFFFFIYFVLVLNLNIVYAEMGHNPDYFYLNSDFITDKFDKLGEKIFEITFDVTIAGHTYTFRPLYQCLFFVVYIFLGLGMWFIYTESYRLSDENSFILNKLGRMKREDKEIKEMLLKHKQKHPEDENKITYELIDFGKKYSSSNHYAVRHANLKVYGGEIFGFLGPNGAGKSTIIKSSVGIQPLTDGTICVCGHDIVTDYIACKSLIGYVPDHYALYEKLTGREYINYIADVYNVSQSERDEIISHYLKLFELENAFDFAMKTYSHGMKQKIAIMAALVHDPKVWILDEPLTGLDPNSIYQVKECMKEHAAKGNIVFFSSHIIDLVEKLCDRVAVIKHGKIRCIKKMEEIEENGSLEQFYLDIVGDNSNDERFKDDPIKDVKNKKPSKLKSLFKHKKKGVKDESN